MLFFLSHPVVMLELDLKGKLAARVVATCPLEQIL
jgi:hypothetical protein